MKRYEDKLREAITAHIAEYGDVFANGADFDIGDMDTMSREICNAQGFSIDDTRQGQDSAIPYLAVSYYSESIGYRIEIGELGTEVKDIESYIRECVLIKSQIDELEEKLATIKK